MRLTPRGHELLEQIAFRAAAGFEPTEIARILDATRAELKHLELPEQVTSWWLRNRMAELRAELVSVSTGRDAREREVAEALVSAIRGTATTTYE